MRVIFSNRDGPGTLREMNLKKGSATVPQATSGGDSQPKQKLEKAVGYWGRDEG